MAMAIKARTPVTKIIHGGQFEEFTAGNCAPAVERITGLITNSMRAAKTIELNPIQKPSTNRSWVKSLRA